MRLTDEQLREMLKRPSIAKANPDLGGLPNPKREPDLGRRSEDRQLEKSTRGVGYRITIISLRRKAVDGHDNLRTGAKPLVDCITRSLGFASDDNPRLQWEYGQVISKRPGTIVKIELNATS